MSVHDHTSAFLNRLGGDSGVSDELISSIKEGARSYVCSECGYNSGDPFIGMIEEPETKIVFYCPKCNRPKAPAPPKPKN
jgi:DNA-directed RNA polymerase subunit RPC12/RpoP